MVNRNSRSLAAPRGRARRIRIVPVAGVVAGALLALGLPAAMAQASPVVIASDTFSHALSSGWGSADKGGAFTVVADKTTKVSVASGVGTVSNLAKSRAVTATLAKTSAQDVEVQGTLGLPGAPPVIYHAWQMRKQANGTAYLGRLDVLAGGHVNLTVSRLTAGNVETALKSVRLPFTVAKNARIRADFKITGTSPVTLTARAWLVGTAEPSWQIATTDTSASRLTAAGSIGIWSYSSGSNRSAITVTDDDLQVTSFPATPAATTSPTPAPSPSPSPTATPTTPSTGPTTEPSRGSIAVGSAAYPVPTGALFVSPTGSDAAAGTISAPLATLAAAVDRAVSGQAIVLRAGSYNESVSIPAKKTDLTIQAYPHEAVWLDGSVPVTNWTKTGSTWTSSGWNTFFPDTLDGIANNPYFVGSSHPLAAQADMVFSDGTQLTQVANAGSVTPGTFAVNEIAKTITIGIDPAGHEMRASNQQQAIYAKSTGTTLEGFGVRRYATPYNVRGAIRLGGASETARDLVIEDDATTGMNVENDDITLDHLTVVHSGMQGIGANSSYGLRLTNSVITDSNREHFNTAPVSGGAKITRSRDITISNNDISNNASPGLWLDESVYDAHIVHNTMSGNADIGISVEISADVMVADNVLTGNGKAGVRLMDTSESKVFNNTIGTNGIFGVQLSQDNRREDIVTFQGHDPRRPLPDPTFSWLTQNDVVANNVFAAGTPFQIYALDNYTNRPVDQWNLTISGNLFNYSANPNQSVLVAWGGADNVALTKFVDPTAFDRAKNTSSTNVATATPLGLAQMTGAITSAAGTAVPLPADVGAAIGQPTGAKHVGAF